MSAAGSEKERADASRFVEELLQETGWNPAIKVTFAGGLLYREYGFLKRWMMKTIARDAGKDKNTSKTADKPHSVPRGSRLAVIEMLTGEMQEHLRAARDHAVDTLDRTGTPQLLPRPQRDFLARKLNVHKSSVTRAFQDDESRELQFLWDLAADLDRILHRGGYAPMDGARGQVCRTPEDFGTARFSVSTSIGGRPDAHTNAQDGCLYNLANCGRNDSETAPN